eukprot:gene19343-19747_t
MVVEELYSLLSKTVVTNGESAGKSADNEPEPSSLAEEKDDGEAEGESLDLSDEAVRLLTLIFHDFSSGRISKDDSNCENDESIMTAKDVANWLITINGQVGRGSEYRSAVEFMTQVTPALKRGGDTEEISMIPEDGFLTLQSFLSIYRKELCQGKVWGVAHDLSACKHPLSLSGGLYTARFDRIFVGGAAQIVAVKDLRPTDGTAILPLPNKNHPSDHLPVMVVLDWK